MGKTGKYLKIQPTSMKMRLELCLISISDKLKK